MVKIIIFVSCAALLAGCSTPNPNPAATPVVYQQVQRGMENKNNCDKDSMTVREFLAQFGDDESCLNHIFETRFGQNYLCPKCKEKTKWYRIKAERAYSCQRCGHHLHPTVGTLFENSRTP